jgi:hypothetical protein
VALQSACEATLAVDVEYLPASSVWEGQLRLVVVVGGGDRWRLSRVGYPLRSLPSI